MMPEMMPEMMLELMPKRVGCELIKQASHARRLAGR
jgi:hypothetical protein